MPLLRPQASAHERHRRHPRARPQARPSLLLHPPRRGRLRPLSALSNLNPDRGRPTRQVLGLRAQVAEWRRLRSFLDELRGCAHAVSPPGAGAGRSAGQPTDCLTTLWTRPGTDDLLGQRDAARGPASRNRRRLDPDEWLVRLPNRATPRTRRSGRCNRKARQLPQTASPAARHRKPLPLDRGAFNEWHLVASSRRRRSRAG